MLIIGITGTLGAGKGTIVDHIVNQFDFSHYSVRNYLTNILISKGLEPNRDQFTQLANALRAINNSPSFLVEELYDQALQHGHNAIIESIRTVGEIHNLKSKGRFFLIAVDADIHIRYDRIKKRKSETDYVDFDTFQSNEVREYISDDINKQNLSACISNADFVINNNGTNIELKEKVNWIMTQILDKDSNGAVH